VNPPSSSLSRFFTAHPSLLFRKERRFYLAYDATWAVLCVAALAAMARFHVFAVAGRPSWAWLGIFPIAVYLGIAAHLCMHNAVHGSFPRSVNRLVGEVCGFIVIVRFASWVVVHLRHHRWADDRERDPHPNFRSFWKTTLHTVVNVERQLMQEYYDQWGDTAENRAAEAFRARVSYGTNLVLLAAWAVFLGPWAFALIFLPANLLAALFVIHFNWVTHNAGGAEPFTPVNLDRGYYRIGNFLFAGIYMHATHHQHPHLFNPALSTTEPAGFSAVQES